MILAKDGRKTYGYDHKSTYVGHALQVRVHKLIFEGL